MHNVLLAIAASFVKHQGDEQNSNGQNSCVCTAHYTLLWYLTFRPCVRTRLSSCCVKLRRMAGTSDSSSARCSSISDRNAVN